MVMKIQSKAKPNSTQSPNAARPAATDPWVRNPTANPRAVATARPQVSRAVSARPRPAITATRGIGRERSRSKKPCSMSSATPAAAPMPENRVLVTTTPGTRKAT
jgi:hypothetical protein